MPRWMDDYPATINFDELLADAERNTLEKPSIDPDVTLEIEPIRDTAGSATYRVRVNDALVPYFAKMSDNELITRCDNREIFVNDPVGKSCHFGGYVTRITPHEAEVVVWID